MSALLVFIIFLLCIIISIPIGISLVIATVLPGAFDPSFTAGGTYVIRSILGGIDSFPLLAVPMFVLSGAIMARGGISKKLFDVFSYFLGNFTAGLPCAVIVTCLFFGAISGSGPATVAAVGSMTIPILTGLGYDKDFSTAVVAVAGGLGVIILPSIPFIMYGIRYRLGRKRKRAFYRRNYSRCSYKCSSYGLCLLLLQEKRRRQRKN